MSSKLPHNRGAVRRIVALAALIVVIVVVGSFGLLFYTARSVDRLQVTEERALISNYLRGSEREMIRHIVSASIWDEAYTKLSPAFDNQWADLYIGGYFAAYMGHELSLVLDSDDRPVYAWRGDGRIAPAETTAFLRDAALLVSSVRQEETLRQDDVLLRNGIGALITNSGVVCSGDGFYLVAISNVIPETRSVAPRPGPNYLVITARKIDAEFLADLNNDMRVTASHVASTTTRELAALPMVGVNNETIGQLGWTPKKPGVDVMRNAVPLFAMAVTLLVLAGLAMATRIRMIFRELAANDASLQQAMDELVRTRDEAAAANVAKSQFLANMSHEIRTPLNGILGMTQVMAREDLSPAQCERLEVVRDSGQALLTVLNDILDISKIEAGKLEIDNHEFDLATAIHTACNAFAGIADQKDVAFRIGIDDEALGIWWGDGARLRQVVSNLASNAVKFTHQGEVAVIVRRTEAGLHLTVRDTGIGIPPDRQGELFQKFNQVDASTTRKFGGTGLGLAISHELVALMGGTMTVASIMSEGSTFAFDLPLEWRAPARPASRVATAAAARASGSQAAPRILAAEDNPTNQLILSALLEPFGVDLTLVGNGREAVDAFAAGNFEVVLMDVQMPVMNGVEATAAIRRLEAERGLAATPILALSANVMSHQVTEYLAAGMSGFIPKPIESAKLLAAIEAALDADEAITVERTASAP
ncbi:MAG: ATP-binding protein [Pseudomonadota bacterium]|uniref:hybrid sensor histidine kinase/response regulator n=1 Tax=Phenylobacterium sp. TaxID=1871053 RepID=UPI0025ECD2FC|nr:ATP-binding protein [Phenylobacterium sp.]MBT9470259.1 response regulator [Phenylobacterium sp.]